MTVSVSAAFIAQFNANLDHLCQQMGSKLRNYVSVERVKGKTAFFDQIGVSTAALKGTKNPATVSPSTAPNTYHLGTPVMDTPFDRRKVDLATWNWGDLIDNDDKVRMLNDPTSDVARSGAMAMGRAIDQIILTAATATAYSGETGATAVTFPVTQIVDSGATSVFNLDKLLEIKTLMDAGDVPEEDRVIAIQAADIKNLLKETKVTSAEYATVKALVNGQIDTYMGFKFVRVSDRIWTAAGYGANEAVAFQKSGIKLAIGQEMVSHIDVRNDLCYSTQCYSEMTLGCTRMQEPMVVKIVSAAA